MTRLPDAVPCVKSCSEAKENKQCCALVGRFPHLPAPRPPQKNNNSSYDLHTFCSPLTMTCSPSASLHVHRMLPPDVMNSEGSSPMAASATKESKRGGKKSKQGERKAKRIFQFFFFCLPFSSFESRLSCLVSAFARNN